MFNLTRQVMCTECSGLNFWKGDPKPTDRLHCRYCGTFVTNYDEYIRDRVRNEAARMLAEFIEADSEQEVTRLKTLLSKQGQQQAAKA